MKTLRILITPMMLVLLLQPIKALAHGTVEEHVNESFGFSQASTIISISTFVLFVVFIILWFVYRKRLQSLNIGKKGDREKKSKLNRSLKWVKGLTIFWLIIAFAGGIYSFVNKDKEVTFTHIHGLDFSADGKLIFVPSHDGLRIFKDNKWHIGQGDQNDYMGFSMVDSGFYSSGHPGIGSHLMNPVGILKSDNGGKVLMTLTLSGESDFHLMDVGFNSHAIYVFNMAPNSVMKSAGVYYSLDGAKTWKQSGVKGFDSEPTSIAVHPRKVNMIAIGSKNGLYISNNYGQTVKNILSGKLVSAVTYGFKNDIWAGVYENRPILYKINPDSQKSAEINVPVQTDDAITYISINPKNKHEIAIATFNREIYLSNNTGRSWIKIVDQGISTK